MSFLNRRSRLLLGAVLLMGLMTGSVHAESKKYVIDGSHTSTVFSISHLGISRTYGVFRKVEGQFSLDAKNAANSTFEVTLDVESIDTNDAKRDEHLKAADFFNSKQFPDITFKAKKVELTKDELKLTGDFTMHGVTKTVTLPFKKGGEAVDPFGNSRIGFSGEFTLKRSDYGMKSLVGPIGDEVAIEISFEGLLQK